MIPTNQMKTTYPVQAVQYLRPDGHKKLIVTELPIYSRKSYERMLEQGLWFELEVLTTGEVSITVSNDKTDVDCEVVANGPEVHRAMLKMLSNF